MTSFQALIELCRKVTKAVDSGRVSTKSVSSSGSEAMEKPFEDMNNIVANLLLNLTRCVCVHRDRAIHTHT